MNSMSNKSARFYFPWFWLPQRQWSKSWGKYHIKCDESSKSLQQNIKKHPSCSTSTSILSNIVLKILHRPQFGIYSTKWNPNSNQLINPHIDRLLRHKMDRKIFPCMISQPISAERNSMDFANKIFLRSLLTINHKITHQFGHTEMEG